MPLFLGDSEVQINIDGKAYTVEYVSSSQQAAEASALEDLINENSQETTLD